MWDPLLISATLEPNDVNFGTQLWFGSSLPKQLRTKNWRGSGLGEYPQFFGVLIFAATIEGRDFKFTDSSFTSRSATTPVVNVRVTEALKIAHLVIAHLLLTRGVA